MKTLIILSFLFLLTNLSLLAQTVTVSEEVSIRNDNGYDIIGRMADRFLLYREQDNNVEIQAFDKRLRQSWKKELKFDNKRFEVVGMVPDKDKFSVIYEYKKKGDRFLRVQQYDAAANMIDSSTILTYKNTFGSPKYQLIYSEDKKMVLIYSIKNQNEINATAYDLRNLRILWSTGFKLEDDRFFNEHMEILMTNLGEMYFIVGKDNRRNKKDEHRYMIYRCGSGSNKIELFAFSMEDHLSFSSLFEYDNRNKNLVAGGLYSDKNLNRCDGYFTVKIPRYDLTKYQIKFTPFEKELVSDLEGKIVDEVRGLDYARIQDIVLRRDGGMLLIFERTKEYERRMASSGRGIIGGDGLRYIVDYYYDNLFVIAIHPDGNTHWTKVLHKKQYSQDDNAVFSSYFILKTPRALRLLFNDDIKLESTVSEYVLDGVGNYDRNSVMSTENQEIRLRFRDAVQIGSNELIIPSERRNRLKLVRVTF